VRFLDRFRDAKKAIHRCTPMAYRGIGVTGLYVAAPGSDPKSVLSLMREFAEKVQDAVG
jgi:hypothetical protein